MRKDNALIQISPYDGHPSKANINRELMMYIRLVTVLDFDLRYGGGNRMRYYAFCGTVFAVFAICGICGIAVFAVFAVLSVFAVFAVMRYLRYTASAVLRYLRYTAIENS